MNMKVNKDIVRRLRLEKSWSQEKLAEEASMNLRTVQRIEKDGVASLQSCTTIADALGVAPIKLTIGSERMEESILSYGSNLGPPLLINSIVFILWGVSQIITRILPLSNHQEFFISFLFLFFAGVVLLAFLTEIANRRLMSIASFCIIAMLVTPADILITLLLIFFMWALFELSIMLARRYKLSNHAFIQTS